MPAVSVIVLVYNVEKYIEQCARSLFEQTLGDLEYVFVDDCTPDSSMAILERVMDDYPNRRSQVKIFHNDVNRGQAFSRRRGVEASTGDYIIHCDSDDWPEPEMYEKMLTKAYDEELDIVICSARRVYPDRVELLSRTPRSGDLFKTMVYQDFICCLWNSLVVRRVYESPLNWPQCNMSEDTSLIYQMAHYCRNWGFIKEALYNYRYVPDSISSSEETVEKVEQIRANMDLAFSFYDDLGLFNEYGQVVKYIKCRIKQKAMKLPWKYYLLLYPEVTIPFLLDRRFTLVERLGHLTKLLGIHGISRLIRHV